MVTILVIFSKLLADDDQFLSEQQLVLSVLDKPIELFYLFLRLIVLVGWHNVVNCAHSDNLVREIIQSTFEVVVVVILFELFESLLCSPLLLDNRSPALEDYFLTNSLSRHLLILFQRFLRRKLSVCNVLTLIAFIDIYVVELVLRPINGYIGHTIWCEAALIQNRPKVVVLLRVILPGLIKGHEL